jgi:hypothetical protein
MELLSHLGALEIGIIIFGMVLLCTIPFLVRYIIIIRNVKRHSKLYLAIMELNEKYTLLFHPIQDTHDIPYTCNSLQQYKNNCNNASVVKYLSGYVKEQGVMWKDLRAKSISNKNEYTKYTAELLNLKQTLSGASYEEVKMKSSLSEEKYKEYEKTVVENAHLEEPPHQLKIICTVAYTSPRGQNHYATQFTIDANNIFENMRTLKKAAQSIEYQRAIMTSSKRYDILKRDGFMCQICGRTAKDGASLEVDHIFPVSKGGKSVDDNLQTLCRDCNQGKKAKV